jgi:hypothetical protein
MTTIPDCSDTDPDIIDQALHERYSHAVGVQQVTSLLYFFQ